MKEYRMHKRAAKREDTSELNGAENVSTDGRKKLIEALIGIQKLGLTIPGEDINIILNAFYMHPDMADANSIKLLIMDAKKRGGIEFAKMRINDLINDLRDTKFCMPLLEYQEWINRRMSFPGILVLEQNGMDDSEVAIGLESCLRKRSDKPSVSPADWDMED